MRTVVTVSTAANLLMAFAEGRIGQFVRSEFKRRPTEYWQDQWPVLMEGFFKVAAVSIAN